MKDKKNRTLKVYGQSGYHYKDTPTIILKGQWLSDIGFEIGDQVCIIPQDGQLLIQNLTKNSSNGENYK